MANASGMETAAKHVVIGCRRPRSERPRRRSVSGLAPRDAGLRIGAPLSAAAGGRGRDPSRLARPGRAATIARKDQADHPFRIWSFCRKAYAGRASQANVAILKNLLDVVEATSLITSCRTSKLAFARTFRKTRGGQH
jgi:hypothetical protein